MKRFFFIMLSLFSIWQVIAQPPIAFPSEYIDFKIDSNYFSINGIYTFKNKTDKTVHHDISFPFATRTCFIDSIRIIEMKDFQQILFKIQKQDILFNLSISPFDSVEYNIYYRQPLAKMNMYILTTTKSWGAPLREAIYTLTVDKYIKIKSFSMVPDSFKTDSERIIYFWNKHNFEPQTDFEITLD